MTDKDNANPVIHATSRVVRSAASNVATAEQWWKDPTVHKVASTRTRHTTQLHDDHQPDQDQHHEQEEQIDSQEIYDLIRSISDPEHPLTLEQLAVVNAQHITVDHGDVATGKLPRVLLEFTPTIPHCSMATLIGLALRVRLLRALPPRYKVDIQVREGTHQSEKAVNKQLNDKERVAAALENQHLLGVVSDCLATASRRGASEEQALELAEQRAKELGLSIAA